MVVITIYKCNNVYVCTCTYIIYGIVIVSLIERLRQIPSIYSFSFLLNLKSADIMYCEILKILNIDFVRDCLIW